MKSFAFALFGMAAAALPSVDVADFKELVFDN